MSQIEQRKKDHVEITVTGDVAYERLTGFEQYHFNHNALPEVNFDEVSTETTFLGHSFSFPLFISSMTGGYTDAGAVNAIIAELCEKENLPFGVGSQRIMLEDPEAIQSFSIVRDKAPSAFIASNIGGVQLIGGLKKDKVNLLIDSIEANAVIVHLNPLQELMQPEGDRNFRGVENGIKQLVYDSPVPVMVKETGAGISGEVAERLMNIGVSVIDIAGAGGTSWAKVENQRSTNAQHSFDNWGVPTVQCLSQMVNLENSDDINVIASGGIRSGMDIAKAICLGADFAASAQPVIKAIVDEGYEGIEKLLNKWKHQLKTILTLLGCEQVQELSARHIRITPRRG